MTSLERVRRALHHEETDRVPRLLYGEAPWENIVAVFDAANEPLPAQA
ncbi:MAG: hypothetical protein ACOYM3_34325 [Terrimicrobiaceae bacterium]